MGLLFLWVLLLLSFYGRELVLVQAEGGVERETIEMLFRVLSPECRDEMDAALVQPDADMSDECKREIEISLDKSLYAKHEEKEEQEKGGSSKSKDGSKGKESSSASKKDDGTTAVMMYVGGFIALFFVSVSVYIYIFNASMPKDSYKSPRKLSKKQRQKGMR